MCSKPRPTSIRATVTQPAKDVTSGLVRRSARTARGTGGALRQMEHIESVQTAPRMPHNAETRRIKDTLDEQQRNPLAPSKASRKRGKELEISHDSPNLPSPVVPRRQVADTRDSFGFHDGRNCSRPQEDRQEDYGSEEGSEIEEISQRVTDLDSGDQEVTDPYSIEDIQQSDVAANHVDESDGEPPEAVVSTLKGKRRASPTIPVQRKAPKKPSTIAARGRGGGARFRQLSESRNTGDSEAPCDVLQDHHVHNGAPHPPGPGHLATSGTNSQTNSGTRPRAVIQDRDEVQVESPVTTKPRSTTRNDDPTTIKFYDPVWKAAAILNRAKVLSRFGAITDNAFPARQVYLNKVVAEFISQALTEFQADGVHPNETTQKEHDRHMRELLFDDLGTYRSDFKKTARHIVAKHWRWQPSNFESSQELKDHVSKLYKDLTKETKYIHGECDEEGKFDNFSSVALQDLCVTGYYTGKSALAVLFPEDFGKLLPSAALAFAATALTGAMDEYSTGVFSSVQFRHEQYSSVNAQFLEIIDSIEGVPHRLRSLQKILKNIAAQGCAKNPAVGLGIDMSAGGQRTFTAHLD